MKYLYLMIGLIVLSTITALYTAQSPQTEHILTEYRKEYHQLQVKIRTEAATKAEQELWQRDNWTAYKSLALEYSHKYNLPANAVIAQAAYESGHGTSNLARKCNNYHGLGGTHGLCFKTPQEGIKYYMELMIHSVYYAKALQYRHDPQAWLAAIAPVYDPPNPAYVENVMSFKEYYQY